MSVRLRTNMNAIDTNSAKRFIVAQEHRNGRVDAMVGADDRKTLSERLRRVAGMYRVYRTGDFDEHEPEFETLLPTEQEAEDYVWNRSYDLFPVNQYWFIQRGDEYVMEPDPSHARFAAEYLDGTEGGSKDKGNADVQSGQVSLGDLLGGDE